MDNEKKSCPLCDKRCALDAIECNRGRLYKMLEAQGNEPGFDRREMSEDAKLMALLRRCATGYRPRSNWNVKSSQRRILAILGRAGEISQRELLDILAIRSASLSELLAKLEAAGYVERTPNEQDKRSVMIRLTEAGKTAADNARAPATAFSVLTDEEREKLTEILNKLIESWDDGESDDEPGKPGFGGFGNKTPFGGRNFPGGPGGFPGGGFRDGKANGVTMRVFRIR